MLFFWVVFSRPKNLIKLDLFVQTWLPDVEHGEEGELKHCSSVTTRGIHAWTQEGDLFQTFYVLIFLKAFFFAAWTRTQRWSEEEKVENLPLSWAWRFNLRRPMGRSQYRWRHRWLAESQWWAAGLWLRLLQPWKQKHTSRSYRCIMITDLHI